jgi:hypothetical protein
MDEARIRELVTELAATVGVGAPKAAAPSVQNAPNATADRLLSRIVLGDILDDSILSARPGDRTFPLRLFFSELGTMLGSTHASDEADHAFTLASGLNFFFRAEMDGESRVRVALEVSRALYTLAHVAKMDPEMVSKAAPLLAALMSGSLERVRLESVDHVRVFDSQLHERTAGSDPSGSRIVRPASFLCRVVANNAVKAKAQVVT